MTAFVRNPVIERCGCDRQSNAKSRLVDWSIPAGRGTESSNYIIRV